MVSLYTPPYTLSGYLAAAADDLRAFYRGVVDGAGNPLTVRVHDGQAHELAPRELLLTCDRLSQSERELGQGTVRATIMAALRWDGLEAVDRAAELMAWATGQAEPSVCPLETGDLTLEANDDGATWYRLEWYWSHRSLYTRRPLPAPADINTATVLLRSDGGEDLGSVVWSP